MARRIVVPAELLAVMCPGEVMLGRRESHYVRNVLRLRRGDAVILMDGQGAEGYGEVRRLDEECVAVELTEFGRAAAQESDLHLTLVLALPRGQRWDVALQKATELGVSRVWPVYTRRTQLRVPAEKVGERVERWQRIAQEAARQSGRAIAPQICVPEPLGTVLDALSHEKEIDLQLVAYVEAAGHASEAGLEDLLSSSRARNVVLLVGPEGGFDPAEIDLCAQYGFHAVSLGPRTLRCETAAIVMVALVQYRLGDLG
jgi:16S rRNA (uracil1498-N3)-methyltransferase